MGGWANLHKILGQECLLFIFKIDRALSLIQQWFPINTSTIKMCCEPSTEHSVILELHKICILCIKITTAHFV